MEEDQIEERIALTQADGFEQMTSGDSVTGKRLFADPEDGKEKEATLRSHTAGASSEAPASSGVPSAEKQAQVKGEAFGPQPETQMGGNVIPTKQNVEP